MRRMEDMMKLKWNKLISGFKSNNGVDYNVFSKLNLKHA